MVKMQVMGYLSKVSAKEYIHVPVLLTEVVNNLVTSKKGVYVDATSVSYTHLTLPTTPYV